MSGTQFEEFFDAGPLLVGTTLNAAVLNTLVLAQGCLIGGGIPPLSGNLTLVQPVTNAVVNTGTVIANPMPASINLTFVATRDTYVDLDNTGVYHQPNVANNATAPAVTANSVRLYKAVSNASAVTAVQQITPNAVLTPTDVSAASETSSTNPLTATSTIADNIARIWAVLDPITGLTQSAVAVDATEAATDDTLSGGTLLSNMDRIRYAWMTLLGLSGWQSQVMVNTKTLILADGTNSASPVLGGTVTVAAAPTATANRGALSSGPGPFSGAGSGHFVGKAAGTILAVNAASGFLGEMLQASVRGPAYFFITATGSISPAWGTGPNVPSSLFVTAPFVQAGIILGSTDQAGKVLVVTGNSFVTLTANTIIEMGFLTTSQPSRVPRAILLQPADNSQFWQYGQLNYQPSSNSAFIGFLVMRNSPANFICPSVQYSYQIVW